MCYVILCTEEGENKTNAWKKNKNKKITIEASYPIDASEVNMAVVVAATSKAMFMASKGLTEAQWDDNRFLDCKTIVVTVLSLLDFTAKACSYGEQMTYATKEQMDLP